MASPQWTFLLALSEQKRIAAKLFYIKDFIWKQIHNFIWFCNEKKDAQDMPDCRHIINAIIFLNEFYVIWLKVQL